MNEANSNERSAGFRARSTARPTVADGPVAAGAMMRQAREKAGVHLASLAMSLKVPAGRLEALETGRIDLLPDPTFARALAASVCRSLRIDADPVLQLLPRTAASLSTAESAAGRTPFRSDSPAGGRSRSGGLSKPIGVVVALLLVATAVLIFAPDFGWQLPGMAGRDASSGTRSADVVQSNKNNAALTAEPPVTGSALRRIEPEPVMVKPAPPVAPAPSVVAALPTAPATSASVPAPMAANASAALSSAQRQAASMSAAAPAAVTTPMPAAQPASNEATLQIQTVVPAWVQVLDAAGAVLVKRTVSAGETVKLNSDALPLKVVIGHSDKTKVQVRGEAYDMDPVSRGGVARFQVK